MTLPSPGSSNALPRLLPYPRLLPLDTAPGIKDTLCYVIRHYGTTGLAVLLYKDVKRNIPYFIFGDWQRNSIDLPLVEKDGKLLIESNGKALSPLLPYVRIFVDEYSRKLLELLRLIKLDQAQFYFSIGEKLTLVDLQISANKFAGPGMLDTLFNKIVPTQEVLRMEPADTRLLDTIVKGTGPYVGDLILKPSVPKVAHDPKTSLWCPLYVEVKR